MLKLNSKASGKLCKKMPAPKCPCCMAVSAHMHPINPLARTVHTLSECSKLLSSLFNPVYPGFCSCHSTQTVLPRKLLTVRTKSNAIWIMPSFWLFSPPLVRPSPFLPYAPSLLLTPKCRPSSELPPVPNAVPNS